MPTSLSYLDVLGLDLVVLRWSDCLAQVVRNLCTRPATDFIRRSYYSVLLLQICLHVEHYWSSPIHRCP